MLLYSLLYLTGVGGAEGLTIADLKAFRQLGSKTPGHPEYGHTLGVETTTGPLGQGLATAVGMALAERMLAAEFGDVVDHHTYVLASDGDLMEGVSQEAIALAGHLKLAKLIVLYDDNGISIDGKTSLADSVDQLAPLPLRRLARAAHRRPRPEGDPQRAAGRQAGRQADADRLPDDDRLRLADARRHRQGARRSARRGRDRRRARGAELALRRRSSFPTKFWRPGAPSARAASGSAPDGGARVRRSPPDLRAEFERRMRGDLPDGLDAAVDAYKRQLAAEAPEMATRKAGEAALKVIAPVVPELITGSADLTGSNNTKVRGDADDYAGDMAGRYVHWGIREHGMAAACNGMALHGGFIPSGASFLVFTDYCRPSLRLAALMGAHVVHVFTHDSIGLGEDGPTHQPVEHLAALRAIPNLLVLRPADSVETVECWQAALAARARPRSWR